MTRSRLALGLALVLVATPLQAQSVIFPRLLDNHYVHLLTAPVIALGVTEGLKALGVPKTLAIVCGLVGPRLVGTLRNELLYPGTIRTGTFWKDKVAETMAAATIVLPLQLKGPARGLTFSVGVVVLAGGLHRWSRP